MKILTPVFSLKVNSDKITKFKLSSTRRSKEMTVTYGPLVINNHVRFGYLATPITFGDFPAIVGSPFFLGVVSAQQEEGAAQELPFNKSIRPAGVAGMSNPVLLSSTGAPECPQKMLLPKGFGKSAMAGSLRVRLDKGQPIIPRNRHIPTISTSNRFSVLRWFRGKQDDSKVEVGIEQKIQRPAKVKQIWVPKKEAQKIKKTQAKAPE
ncbi:hypothetical protein Taro_039086, partial [Colocasia esculenta]|nr:hypothetical protein [Colocasia esculenta]